MKLISDVQVVMRDGAKLATDVYTPDGQGPFPTILIRTPYNRTSARCQRKPGIYTAAGFAVALQDVRNTGGSLTGQPFYPYRAEHNDGHDTIRWLEKQPFCNGRIGTHGGSYLAHAQWLVAPDAPASLQCMVAYVGPQNFHQGYFTGGALHLCITLGYGLVMAGAVTAATGGWPGMHKRFWHLPLCDADLVDGKHNPWFRDILLTPTADPFWKQFDAVAEPAKIKAPVLQMNGWFDFYPMPSLRTFELLRHQGGSAAVRQGSKYLAGAWSHDRNSTSRCGDLDFGTNVLLDLYTYELRWFQYWLMDRPTGIDAEPPLRLFTMGANTWQDFTAWPAPDAELRPLYLHSRGRANTLAGDGALSWEKPGSEPADTYRYDPLDPVPMIGGNHSCDYQQMPAGPLDQTAVEQRADVLVYSTPRLQAPVEIAGPIQVCLYATSSAPDTDFTAKLVDVQPDGRPINLSEGIIRASCRESVANPSLIQPGKTYRYTIELVDLSHVFLAGHAIRLEISSSNFPKYARNLNTGQNNYTTTATQVAEQQVCHSGGCASALLLWVRQAGLQYTVTRRAELE